VAIVGISASSRADLLAELDRLGTNLLQVRAGGSSSDGESTLPRTAPHMIRRIGPVHAAAATSTVEGATVRRNHLVPLDVTGGLSVVATELNLLDVLDATVAEGVFLSPATDGFDAVVLGAVAAERLGLDGLGSRSGRTDGLLVMIDGHWFRVIGVLDPVPLAPDIDRSVLIGYEVAQRLFTLDGSPSVIRVRTDPDRTLAVRSVLAPTANPQSPHHVEVTRPSDLLIARDEVDSTLTAVLLGLGSVALLVGGIGIANVMVISVLERSAEIGVRRALGATRRHIRWQFLVESMLLAGVGGAAGVALGAGIATGYAGARGWPVAMPTTAVAGAIAGSLAVGALAGLYPAVRASRLAPAEAVRSA
jgi:putative ABC transport system permease protein